MTLTSHAGEWYRMVAAQAISVKGWYKSSNDQTTSLFSMKNSHSPFEKSPWILQTWMKSIFTDSESLSLNREATCLLLSSPRNFQYEIKTDKYRPYPSMISLFTSDSQHPPKSRHAVHLGVYDIVRSLILKQPEMCFIKCTCRRPYHIVMMKLYDTVLSLTLTQAGMVFLKWYMLVQSSHCNVWMSYDLVTFWDNHEAKNLRARLQYHNCASTHVPKTMHACLKVQENTMSNSVTITMYITFSKRGNGVKIWQKLHF